MTKSSRRPLGITFYLVGKVPVRIEERAEGVDVLAFNPLLGGFVKDARYYGAVLFEDMGRVQDTDQAGFDAAVQDLQRQYNVPA